MKKILFVILTIVIGFGFAKTITVTTGEWEPFTSSKMKGNGIGLSIIRDVFKNAGIDVKYKFYPWKRAYETAKMGKAEATALWFKTPEREKEFYFGKEPVVAHKTVFFFLKNKFVKWDKISDLKEFRIGVTRGYSYGVEFDKLAKDKTIKTDVANSDLQNFKKLLAGRVDIFVCEFDVGYNILAQNFKKGDQLKVTNSPKILREDYTYLAFSKKKPGNKKLSEVFDKELKKIKNNGKYETYFKK